MEELKLDAEIMGLANQIYFNLDLGPAPNKMEEFNSLVPYFRMFKSLFPVFTFQF